MHEKYSRNDFHSVGIILIGLGNRSMEIFSRRDNFMRGQRRPIYVEDDDGARCLYGNKPNGNWHNAIKRLSLRLFRCSVFSVGICAHLRAFYHTLVYPTLSLSLSFWPICRHFFFWFFLFFGTSEPSCLMHFNMYLQRWQIFFLSDPRLHHTLFLSPPSKALSCANTNELQKECRLKCRSELFECQKWNNFHRKMHRHDTRTIWYHIHVRRAEKRRRSSISIGICNASRKSWIRFSPKLYVYPTYIENTSAQMVKLSIFWLSLWHSSCGWN